MRDFYDIHVLINIPTQCIDNTTLKKAFIGTCNKRGSLVLLPNMDLILQEIAESSSLVALWKSYQRKYQYASSVSWNDVIKSVLALAEIVK
jgi:hypothetical protein